MCKVTFFTSQIFALSSHDDQIYENFGAVAFKRSFFFKKG